LQDGHVAWSRRVEQTGPSPCSGRTRSPHSVVREDCTLRTKWIFTALSSAPWHRGFPTGLRTYSWPQIGPVNTLSPEIDVREAPHSLRSAPPR